MLEIIGQIMGIVGTVVAVLSFQCKDNKKFFIWQAVCGACFAVNFSLLWLADCVGNFSASSFLASEFTVALLHFFNIVRAMVFGFTKGRVRRGLAVVVGLLYIVSTVLTFEGFTLAGIMALLALVAQLVGTTVMYMDNGKVIRVAQFSFISPVFLVNSVLSKSIGGVLCEIFNLASIAVALIRHRKDGFVSVNSKK